MFYDPAREPRWLTWLKIVQWVKYSFWFISMKLIIESKFDSWQKCSSDLDISALKFSDKASNFTEILQFFDIILDIIIVSYTIDDDFNLILHDFQSTSKCR